MYESLIKELRECSKVNSISLYKRGLMNEAADAIEELQKALDVVNDAHNEGYDVGYWARRRDYEPKWIPVTERLPSVGDKVIVAIRDESGDTRYDYTNTGRYSGNRYKWVVEDEYCSWVTHWMPLPTPPKEET